jgi:hypothetical protein
MTYLWPKRRVWHRLGPFSWPLPHRLVFVARVWLCGCCCEVSVVCVVTRSRTIDVSVKYISRKKKRTKKNAPGARDMVSMSQAPLVTTSPSTLVTVFLHHCTSSLLLLSTRPWPVEVDVELLFVCITCTVQLIQTNNNFAATQQSQDSRYSRVTKSCDVVCAQPQGI